MGVPKRNRKFLSSKPRDWMIIIDMVIERRNRPFTSDDAIMLCILREMESAHPEQTFRICDDAEKERILKDMESGVMPKQRLVCFVRD